MFFEVHFCSLDGFFIALPSLRRRRVVEGSEGIDEVEILSKDELVHSVVSELGGSVDPDLIAPFF